MLGGLYSSVWSPVNCLRSVSVLTSWVLGMLSVVLDFHSWLINKHKLALKIHFTKSHISESQRSGTAQLGCLLRISKNCCKTLADCSHQQLDYAQRFPVLAECSSLHLSWRGSHLFFGLQQWALQPEARLYSALMLHPQNSHSH